MYLLPLGHDVMYSDVIESLNCISERSEHYGSELDERDMQKWAKAGLRDDR